MVNSQFMGIPSLPGQVQYLEHLLKAEDDRNLSIRKPDRIIVAPRVLPMNIRKLFHRCENEVSGPTVLSTLSS